MNGNLFETKLQKTNASPVSIGRIFKLKRMINANPSNARAIRTKDSK